MKSDANTLTPFEKLKQFIEKNLNYWQVPGLVVGILNKGKVSTIECGVTNTNHPLPITNETLFQIGSITKTYVGTAIMRLIEMGKLELDATVQSYLPEFKVADKIASTQVTLRHLLTHSGGWDGDYWHGTGEGDDALAKYVADMTNLEQMAPLGKIFSYNNSAFGVLGHLIEIATGKTFETALKELVLKPLGLDRSYLNSADVMTQRFVVGHYWDGKRYHVCEPWGLDRSSRPMGAITCDIKDIMHYARFHMGKGQTEDGSQILTTDSLSEMHSPHITIVADPHWDWGLSWEVRQVGNIRQISHGGATNGQMANLAMIPQQDFAIAVLTNSESGQKATKEITSYALEQYLEIEISKPKASPIDVQQLAALTGTYSRPFGDVVLGSVAGKLICLIIDKKGFPNEDSPPQPSPPPITLAACGHDRLMATDGAYKDSTLDIIRREDGSIGWLRVGYRIYKRLV